MSAVREGPVMKLMAPPVIHTGAIGVMRLEHHPDLLERLQEGARAEHRDMRVGQQRRRARAAGPGEQDEGARLRERPVRARHPERRSRGLVTVAPALRLAFTGRGGDHARGRAERDRPRGRSRAPPRSSATISRAPFSAAICASTAGTSSSRATRWKTPATRSNSAWKRSRACGPPLGELAPHGLGGLRGPRRTRRRPWRGRALASWPSRAAPARGTGPAWPSTAEILPPLGEGPRAPPAASRAWPSTCRRRAAGGGAGRRGRTERCSQRPARAPARKSAGDSMSRRARPKTQTLAAGGDAAAVEMLAQLHEHARDVDAHRAHVLARAAQRRGMGEVLDRAIPFQHGGEQDADGAGIRVAVRVPADLPVHRADVETGAAAQTVEGLAQRPRDLPDATVVHQDEVQLLGPLQLARPAGAAHQRRVGGQLLPGRAAGQDGEEDHEVGHAGDDLLHAHHRHVDAGQRGDHAAVALVGHEHDGAGVRDREVGPGDPHVGLQELLPQLARGPPR